MLLSNTKVNYLVVCCCRSN